MGISGFGTTLKKGAAEIAELTSITGPSMEADTIDVSNHGSADGFRQYVAGMRDGGEVSIEGNFTNEAGQAALVTDFAAGSSNQYVITFPTTPEVTWTFNAIVSAFESSAPYDDKLSFTATLKVTGKPVLAAGA